MKRISENIIRSLAVSLCAAFLGVAAASCSDDDKGAAPSLAQPELKMEEIGTTTLRFAWEGVSGARQYCYKVKNSEGKVLQGGITQDNYYEAIKLSPLTAYSIELTAYPTELGSASSSTATLQSRTTIKNYNTAYKSSLQANVSSVTNRGTISEERSEEDEQAGWFGVFTISKFCGMNNSDMVFRVNRDKTITVLNGEGYDEQGRVILKTGKSTSATLSFDKIYIDESSAVFDTESSTLTFSAKNNGTGAKLRESTTETINWTAP